MFQAIVLYLILVSNLISLSEHRGSTPHLREIVIGRCWDFQRQKNHEVAKKNCSKIWDTFSKAFVYRDPCSVSFADYRPYFDEVGMDIVRPNKSLFWSGTYVAAHMFSEFDLRYTTLEDTMAGWIVNDLFWCGTQSNASHDGIDYSSCPESSKSCHYVTSFWGQASQRFAEKASGIVRVMVNGSRLRATGYPAYKNDSFFAMYELPNLRVKSVTNLLVLVVHKIGDEGTDIESCGKGSIKLLQDTAKNRGIKTTCHDDPNEVEHLLCVDHPKARECVFFKNSKRNIVKADQTWKGWKMLAITMSGIAGACLIAAALALLIWTRRHIKENSSVCYAKHTDIQPTQHN